MEGLTVIFLVGVIGVVLVLSMAHRSSRSNQMIDDWAAAHGYRVINTEHRNFIRGPFFWTTSKGQTVYHVTFADAEGRRRRAFVRCGSWLGGLWSDKVDVAWEE
jgi:hypothetical protein